MNGGWRLGASQARRWTAGPRLVGLGRFELPTSPLSGVRSNQLSYRPGEHGTRRCNCNCARAAHGLVRPPRSLSLLCCFTHRCGRLRPYLRVARAVVAAGWRRRLGQRPEERRHGPPCANPRPTALRLGGNPAAGSPTATLLRLHPSHRPHRGDRFPEGSANRFWCNRLPWCDGRCVQGPGTYSPRHADSRLLAIPTSCSRVADCNPDYDRCSGIGSPSRVRDPLCRPL